MGNRRRGASRLIAMRADFGEGENMQKQGFAIRPRTHYHVELRDRSGKLKWEDDFHNVVTVEGMNHIIDATFKTGVASPEWYIGLVDGAEEQEYAAEDTMAAHAGWTEHVDYSEEERQVFTPGEIAEGAADNSGDRAAFTITADGTVAGCFLTTDKVKEATDGVLHGVGAFSGGVRPVEIGDTLRVTTTVSVEE
jgi:hypothetical protein